MTIIILIIYVAAIIYFSRILFIKINPFISIIPSFEKTPNITVNTNGNLGLKIKIFFSNGPIEENLLEYLDMRVGYYNETAEEEYTDTRLVDCSDIYKNYDPGQGFCIEAPYLKSDTLNTLFSIKVKECDPENNLGITCKSKEDIAKFINNKNFYHEFNYYEPNPSNYTHPLFERTKRIQYPMKITNSYRFVYSFDILESKTDDGIIFENINNKNNIQTSLTLKKEYTPEKKTDDFQIKVEFGVSGTKITYERAYKKLQDVLANIGGIFPILNLIGRVIVNIFNPIIFNISFVNKLFKFDNFSSESSKNHLGEIKNSSHRIKQVKREMTNHKSNVGIDSEMRDLGDKTEIKEPSNNNVIESLDIGKNLKLKNELIDFKNTLKKKNRLKISCFDILASLYCRIKCINKNFLKKKEILKNITKFATKRTDILSLVKQKRDIELIKSSLFTEDEQLILKFASRPNYAELNKMLDNEKKENSILKLFSYYKLHKDQDKTEKSKRIFDLLDKDVILYFEEKIKSENIYNIK